LKRTLVIDSKNISKRSEERVDSFDDSATSATDKETKPKESNSKRGFIFKMNFQVLLLANLKIKT
jgi:hypothetical protein